MEIVNGTTGTSILNEPEAEIGPLKGRLPGAESKGDRQTDEFRGLGRSELNS